MMPNLPNESTYSFKEVIVESWIAWILTADVHDLDKVGCSVVHYGRYAFSDYDEDSHDAAHQEFILLQFRRRGVFLDQTKEVL